MGISSSNNNSETSSKVEKAESKSREEEKESIIVGHSKPIKKKETLELFSREDSMCKIESRKVIKGKLESIKGTGFFLYINNKDIHFNKCLITNNHILDENDIEINSEIIIEYKGNKKMIVINEKRKAFTDIKIDYTCIEILDEDNIQQFFKTEKNIDDMNSYKGQDIFILQYPNGNELSFSIGKIISIEDNKIKHTSSTEGGSSGSPIISRYSNSSVIGLHYGTNNKFNLSITIDSIIKDLIKKYNNIILAEIIIKAEDINKEIRIINSYEEFIRKNKYKYEDKYENEKEIKAKCSIEINDNKLPFCYYYKFENIGKYKIKYSFSDKLEKTNNMFFGCSSLISIDLSNFNTQKVTNMSWMFTRCKFLTNIDLTNFNTKNVTDMSYMFYECHSLENIDLSKFKTQNDKNMSWLFCECKSLKDIDLSNFNTKNATNMKMMFFGCKSLTKIDLSKFSTEDVTDMGGMFRECNSLTTIILSNFNTKNVTNFGGMFYGCNSLTNIDLSNFNTKNATNIGGMFRECKSLTKIDLSSFSTKNVTNMGGMFYGCYSLTEINLSDFNTQNVSNMSYMFNECKLLKKENIITKNKMILDMFDSNLI